jgi:hypothetical protein
MFLLESSPLNTVAITEQGMAALLSHSSTVGSRTTREKGDTKMRAIQRIFFAVLISSMLTFGGGAMAQAQGWQNQKEPERPKEKPKDEPKRDERKDDRRDGGKKKPY